jgi:hypothetical protein
MKQKLYIALLVIVLMTAGYVFYATSLQKFYVQDVSKPESFKLYQSGKPINVDLTVYGDVDSAFTVRVVDLSSRGVMFDSTFIQKQVNYTGIIDYYTGRGVEIVYTPRGATIGDVKLGASINADF